MKKYSYECHYCGEKWEEDYSYNDRCGKCGDKNLRIKLNEKIDYYENQEEG